eukprot:GCRY01001690.1.p1 GENE.GCRY01001690.1~~GCRY01001690.1.p1  ORF type:complete len:208 (+),score=27.22 GCRY01001690.1:160-783(+)
MSLSINWHQLLKATDPSLLKAQVETELNKNPKQGTIVDTLTVSDVSLGNKAPEVTVLRLNNLSETSCRLDLSVVYTGDAYIQFKTKVQINGLVNNAGSEIHCDMGMLLSDSPVVLPITVTISEVVFKSQISINLSENEVHVDVSKDSLEKVSISSTFSFFRPAEQKVQKVVRSEIENALTTVMPTTLANVLRIMTVKHLQSKQLKTK